MNAPEMTLLEMGSELDNGAVIVKCTARHVLAMHENREYVVWTRDIKGGFSGGFYTDSLMAAVEDLHQRSGGIEV